MEKIIIGVIVDYIILTVLTFAPILAGIIVYKKYNGKENKRIDQLSIDLICGGSLIGIYWTLLTLNNIAYLMQRPSSKDKIINIIKSIFN